MRPGLGVARIAALASGLAAASVEAACLALVAHPDGAALAALEAEAFAIRYVHSVTRTPVDEHYRLDAGAIVQTAIRFREHGPGLPTEADPGQRFARDADGLVATLDRPFAMIVMRVHADQSPRLVVNGSSLDLAAWGNRSIALRAGDGCATH